MLVGYGFTFLICLDLTVAYFENPEEEHCPKSGVDTKNKNKRKPVNINNKGVTKIEKEASLMISYDQIKEMRMNASFAHHNKNYWSKENDNTIKLNNAVDLAQRVDVI